MKHKFEFLVIGSGVVGLTVAIKSYRVWKNCHSFENEKKEYKYSICPCDMVV